MIFQYTLAPPHNRIIIAQKKGDHGATVKNLKWNETEHRSALMPINPTASEPTAEGWGAIAMLVSVEWVNKFGSKVVVRRDEGITAEELIEARPA